MSDYLKHRIGVTWDANESAQKTLQDIKFLLVETRVWQTDEDQFLRRMIRESEVKRELDWKKLIFVSGVGGFIWVGIWIILAQLFGVISISVPTQEFMGF